MIHHCIPVYRGTLLFWAAIKLLPTSLTCKGLAIFKRFAFAYCDVTYKSALKQNLLLLGEIDIKHHLDMLFLI